MYTHRISEKLSEKAIPALEEYFGEYEVIRAEEKLYEPIDDFEDYYGNSRYAAVPVSGYDLLLQNWQDGTTNGSGSEILDLQEGCMEFSFDNSASPYYSEVERMFASPLDLITGENFRYVSMWYKGSANVSGLYLKLYNGDPNTGPNETLRISDPAVSFSGGSQCRLRS